MQETKINLDKKIKEIEENEYLRETGFKELISSSVKIIFEKLPKRNKDFLPLENQTIILNYEMSDFSDEVTEIESTSHFRAKKYQKILILVALKRLKDSKYVHTYKDNEFELKLEFNFLRTSSNTYPVEVKVSLKNLPENSKIQNLLIQDFSNTLFNRLSLPKEITEEKLKNKGTHIQSGHYGDMKLKHQYEAIEKGLNNTLEFKDQALAKLIKEEKIVLGIRLSVSEDRVLNSILKLLHDKSDKTLGSDNFFKGNQPPEKSNYGGRVVDFPVLSFTPAELYKEYISKSDYSGAEANHIKKTLENLATKNFLFIYKRHKFDDKGNQLIDRIEEYQPLLKIIKYYENITVEEDTMLDKDNNSVEEKANIIISLNHIFIDQINTKFIEYPNDINQRTVIASGGVRQVTESNVRIRDYFLREISNGHNSCEINEDKIPYILGLESFIKSSKKKRIEQKIKEAIEFSLNIKIILSYEISTGTQGQNKYKFNLNQNF